MGLLDFWNNLWPSFTYHLTELWIS